MALPMAGAIQTNGVSPAPAGAVFLGKSLANYALLLAVEIVSLGIFAIFMLLYRR